MKSGIFSSDALYAYRDGTSALPGVQPAVIPVKNVEGTNGGRLFVMDMQASNGNALVFACGIFRPTDCMPAVIFPRWSDPRVC